MSEFARLEEKLAKLRQRERAVGEGRKLRGVGGDALLASIVTEIDETILPRRLVFETPGGAVHLAVANRRLQALLAPAPASLPQELVGHALPDVEDPAVGELGEALKSLLDQAEAVPVSAKRLTEAFGSDIGVPAEQLPRVWTVAETTALSPDDILSQFLAGLDTGSTAWLRIEGEEVTAQGGPEAMLTALTENAAVFLDGYFSKFDVAFREPSYTCGTLVSPGVSGATAMFFVEIASLSAIVSAPSARILGIATTWQRLVAE
ncbi:MAG: hypothetical protein AAF230_02005 [Pseudomonadota bacterium]